VIVETALRTARKKNRTTQVKATKQDYSRSPEMSGVEQQTDLCPYVPVIVITARPEQAALAAQVGIDGLMEKPLDIASLLETIHILLTQPRKEHKP
jgi:DNA-binding response OmpR family regulator